MERRYEERQTARERKIVTRESYWNGGEWETCNDRMLSGIRRKRSEREGEGKSERKK